MNSITTEKLLELAQKAHDMETDINARARVFVAMLSGTISTDAGAHLFDLILTNDEVRP